MDETTKIRIVLVKPMGALNIGSVARIMKNMGLSRLVLVNPQCDPLASDAYKMAMHATDVLEQAEQVNTLPEALQDCTQAIATTSSDRRDLIQLETPREVLPTLITNPQPSALIFGPEDHGLSQAELTYAQRFIRIPSSPIYPALNLAQSVAICCYELYQIAQEQTNQELSPLATNCDPDYASFDVLEGYYQQMENLLLKIGYLYPHTAASRMDKFRRIFYRSQLTTAEVYMLRGILSQVEWAIQTHPAADHQV